MSEDILAIVLSTRFELVLDAQTTLHPISRTQKDQPPFNSNSEIVTAR